jgi:hypothetical protein
MQTLRIGGIPEPFTEPFILAKDLQNTSIPLKVVFEAVPGGSGAALDLVESGKLDVALALTESAVARKLKESSRLDVHSIYVSSPLFWGVIISAIQVNWTDLRDLDDSVRRGGKIRAGFSRVGSGSYLILFMLAESRGWLRTKPPDEIFTLFELGSFDSLLSAAARGDIDLFVWESCFTRESSAARQGLVRIIDEYAPPWPAFVLVCRNDSLVKESLSTLKKTLEPIQDQFCTQDGLKILQHKYHFSTESAQLWMSRLKFANADEALSSEQWERVSHALDLAGISSRF